MGDKKRMGDTGDKVILYAAQADAVLKAIERDGRCFSREEYVRRKYGESGPIFLTVYRWFVKEAAKLVPKPEGALLVLYEPVQPGPVGRNQDTDPLCSQE